jgi:hypothetical protein
VLTSIVRVSPTASACDASHTVSVYVWVASLICPSLTRIVTGKAPAVVAVPTMLPSGCSVRPGGRPPDTTEKVNVAFDPPPDAPNARTYGTLRRAAGRNAVVMFTGGGVERAVKVTGVRPCADAVTVTGPVCAGSVSTVRARPCWSVVVLVGFSVPADALNVTA